MKTTHMSHTSLITNKQSQRVTRFATTKGVTAAEEDAGLFRVAGGAATSGAPRDRNLCQVSLIPLSFLLSSAEPPLSGCTRAATLLYAFCTSASGDSRDTTTAML